MVSIAVLFCSLAFCDVLEESCSRCFEQLANGADLLIINEVFGFLYKDCHVIRKLGEGLLKGSCSDVGYAVKFLQLFLKSGGHFVVLVSVNKVW